MTASQDTQGRQWLYARLKRHISELSRLAPPVIMMRVCVMGLGIVDTAMVGHYATNHLAWLNLANQSVFIFILLVGMGLIAGTTVYTASAFGTDDYREAGRVWRRTLPYGIIIGLILMLVTLPSELWLTLLGQETEAAERSGKILQILALGLPAHMIFITCTMFLEGIKRPVVGFYLMVLGNIANAALNYVLIFGMWGFPEMGAEGSAWTSTILRWGLTLAILAYLWFSKTTQKYGIRNPHGQSWSQWRDQRQMGYASCVSLAIEVMAFSGLAVFAGWLGIIPVAAHGVMSQVIGIPLMVGIGLGVASTIRVGIAVSRNDTADILLAGVTGVGLGFIIVGVFTALIYLWPTPLILTFTQDRAVLEALLPLVGLYALSMLFDSTQMATVLVLRGLKEIWWPTYLQSFSFGCVMLPASYLLAIHYGLGLEGLAYGMLLGVGLSSILSFWRFLYLTTGDRVKAE